MKITKTFSIKKGEEFIKKNHPQELTEIVTEIKNLDASLCLTKVSDEKTMKGRILFSPTEMNSRLKNNLHSLGWTEKSDSGKKHYKEPRIYFGKNRFREMDAIKNKVGLEIQFGKYAFMGYDIFSKMVIFNKHGKIDCGVELVAGEDIIKQMSTGVSSFDQILVDLENRGESNLDIPVYIIALGLTDEEKEKCLKITNGPLPKMKKSNGSRPGPK